MEPQRLVADLRRNFRERPYWTTAAIVGVGWILGRSLPLRALIAVAGIGARAAVATALEDAVRDRVRPRRNEAGEAT
jgi:lauroyl/myristoyl acyltransferase